MLVLVGLVRSLRDERLIVCTLESHPDSSALLGKPALFELSSSVSYSPAMHAYGHVLAVYF